MEHCEIEVVVLLLLEQEMVEHLFEDIFTVTRLDPDGKKFDRGIILPGCTMN